MFRTIWLVAAICAFTPSFSQLKITGSIKSRGNSESLPGATIWITPDNEATISDSFGQFSFTGLAAGEYSLTVSYIGYADTTLRVSVPAVENISIFLRETSILTEAVIINATRPAGNTPTTFSSLSRQDLERQNFGQDVPYLLNLTPSVVATSDAGTGIGYTGIRIRGSDPTRINVTINGIPYNDSESLGTFWVDIPDIASSAENLQVQRGVGTSTNGAGAFGATINLQTTARNDQPYAILANAAGSFGTRRHTLALGTGLLNDHWILDGKLSRIHSDGYIDRAFADLSSYYLSAAYHSDKTIVKAITFGGKERTYQAWYGVPESRLSNDAEAMAQTAANEGWNTEQTENLFNSGRTFNPYLYEDQVDDYRQDHYQLHFSRQIATSLVWNTSLHYTRGKGYYEEYRYDSDFSDYGLAPVVIGDSTVEGSDLVRRRWLDNHFYGATYSLQYDHRRWNAVLGGGWNRYVGDHFGEIIWAEISAVPPGFRYYLNTGDKRDLNTFVKVNYELSDRLNLFADLQHRRVTYESRGTENAGAPVDIHANFDFFNPKAGFTFTLNDRQRVYASFAIANKEPVREDFLADPDSQPGHERLRNTEVGYQLSGKRYALKANYYLMQYRDQLVLTGMINDVGAPVRTNAGKSYRTGLELEGRIKIGTSLEWNANFTLSENKIESYSEALFDYATEAFVITTYEDTDISFSPAIIAASQLSFIPFRGGEIAALTKYVGRQYLDNTENTRRSIDAYFINDLRLSYRWKPSFAKELAFSLLINNILNHEYESNGYTWGYLYGGDAYRENYYFPQAGRNFLAMVTLKF